MEFTPVTLILVAVLVLFPAAFVWSCTIGGICHAFRGKKAAKTATK